MTQPNQPDPNKPNYQPNQNPNPNPRTPAAPADKDAPKGRDNEGNPRQ